MKKLLEAKADSRSHDRFDKAALFYASQVGDSDAVKALLKTEFRLNDGSLHEAARNLHRDCVAALIKAKYDPNFRSSREEYGGRNALQEMAVSNIKSLLGNVRLTFVIVVQVRWLKKGARYGGNHLVP